jgi:chitinase
MRIRHLSPAVIGSAAVAAALAAVPLAAAAASPSATPAVNSFPARYSAPYLQISSSDAKDMAADMSASGDKYYSLAFLTPSKSSPCTPFWEDDNQAVNNSTIVNAVKSLQAAGGQVIPSFGGESGGEISDKCSSAQAAETQYANVLSTFNTNRLDFDIEGSVLSNGSGNTLRDAALKLLQKDRPGTQIDFTLPVNPNGLPSSETKLLTNAVNAGVNINLVNIMTMDFGNGQNVLADSQEAIKDTAAQLKTIFKTSGPDYAGLGATPIAGKNDDNENFTQSDAKTIEALAVSDKMQELAFWEVDQYDKPLGYAYSKIFEGITTGSTSGGS